MIQLFDGSTFMSDEDSPSPRHLFDFIFLNFIPPLLENLQALTGEVC